MHKMGRLQHGTAANGGDEYGRKEETGPVGGLWCEQAIERMTNPAFAPTINVRSVPGAAGVPGADVCGSVCAGAYSAGWLVGWHQ